MSMLAEPRQRQKWSVDPRNTAWSKDESRFGYQLMKKMGWSDGKGLGAQEDGEVSHVKIKKKDDNLGVGAKKSYGDTWLAHQDDFTAILSSLNSINGETEAPAKKVVSLESAVKKSRKKIMYSKFIKSKDLSRASDKDMVGIFGPKSKSCPSSPQVVSETEDEGNKSDSAAGGHSGGVVSHSHGFTTISSTCSMQDYFAQKVKALKAKASAAVSPEVTLLSSSMSEGGIIKEDVPSNEESVKKKKKRKRKHAESEIVSCCEGGEMNRTENSSDAKENRTDDLGKLSTVHAQENNSEEIDIEPKRKKKKKSKDRTENEEKCSSTITIDENSESVHEKKKKKKKKKTSDTEDGHKDNEIVNKAENSECVNKKKKKKRKKRSCGD